jgi:hypothetical protein
MLEFSPATTVMEDSFGLAKAIVELTERISAEKRILVFMLFRVIYLVAQKYGNPKHSK